MKKFYWIILLFLSSTIFADTLAINQFKGLITDDDPLFIDGTPDSQNVVTDVGSGLNPRQGFIPFSTETCRKKLYQFPHSNGTKYIISIDSGNVKANTGAGNFTIFISTVDPSVKTVGATLGDRFYFCNQTDGLKYWDSSNVVVSTTLIKANVLTAHKGRLWASGVVGDLRTIYGSGYLDGGDWSLKVNPVDTDPFRIQVQGSLDEIITGLFSSFNDVLIWMKPSSFGGIYGSRRSNFTSTVYSPSIGCSYPESMQSCDGYLRWLGQRRTMYQYDGSNLTVISDHNTTLFNTIAQGDVSNGGITFTTSKDWNEGTIGIGLDTTTVNGDVVLNASTTSVSVFFATGSFRNGGTSDSIYVNYSTGMTGAIASMFIPTCTLPLDKVTMSFSYKSNVVEGYQSWVTLHTGATCPNSVVLDTSTNKISENTNTTGNLTIMTTNYYFSQSTSIDKRLSAGNTYWFVLHTTVTNPNTTPTVKTFSVTYPPLIPTQQIFSIPVSVSSITAYLYGGQGNGYRGTADSTGGAGGFVCSSISVVSEQNIYITIGKFNYNSADIRIGGTALSDRVLVAGGGGAAGTNLAPVKVNGGMGGYTNGGDGFDSILEGGGKGGSQSTGGAGGIGTSQNGGSGGLGIGGTGCTNNVGYGGSGYYGGGAGGNSVGCNNISAGGGGSSWSKYGGTTFLNGVNGSDTDYIGLNGYVNLNYIEHAVFYTYELSNSLSSTTLLYTSSFTTSGSNYSTGLYATAFQVYFATTVFTSTFTSKPINASLNISAFNYFYSNQTLNDGNISYRIFSDTDTNIDINNPTTFIASQTISDSQIPTIQVGQYISLAADFSRTFSTQTPTLHDFSINWIEGNPLDVASSYFDRRYWLSCAISSTSNNTILVYDRNQQWQKYSGINADCFNIYGLNLLFGNNSGIFQAQTGNNDNGNFIYSYYKTKSYLLSGLDFRKTFNHLWMTTSNSDAILSTEFYIDGNPTSLILYDYTMNQTLGNQNFDLPFHSEQLEQGKSISFKFTVNSLYNWRILNANLYYTSETEPSQQ